MLLKYCRPVGYPGDLQVHPRVDPYPYFATRYGYVLNPQLSKPAGNNPGIDWVNPRQTLGLRRKHLLRDSIHKRQYRLIPHFTSRFFQCYIIPCRTEFDFREE